MRRRTDVVALALAVAVGLGPDRARADEAPELKQLTLHGDGAWRPTAPADPPSLTGLWLRKDIADRQVLLHQYALDMRNILQDSVDRLSRTVDEAEGVLAKDDEVIARFDGVATRLENLVTSPPPMSDIEKALWLGGAVVVGACVGFGASRL